MKSLSPVSTEQRQQQNKNKNNNNNSNDNSNNKKKKKGDVLLIAINRDMQHHESNISSLSIDNDADDGLNDFSDDSNRIQSQSALSSSVEAGTITTTPTVSSISSLSASESEISITSSASLSTSPPPSSLLKDHAYAWDAAVEALTRYCERSTVIEPSLLTELRLETIAKYSSGAVRMLSGELQGRLLALLSSLSNAMNILELGAFTGYSAICLAQGLDGTTTMMVQSDKDNMNNADIPHRSSSSSSSSSGSGSSSSSSSSSSSGSNSSSGGSSGSSDPMNSTVVAQKTIKKRRVITCEPDVKSATIAQAYITKGGFNDQVGW